MLACGGIWWGFEGEQVNQDLEGEERGSGDLFTTNSGYRCSYDYITAHVIYNIQYILFTERSHSHHHISATSLRNARLASHPPCDAHAVPMRHDNLCAHHINVIPAQRQHHVAPTGHFGWAGTYCGGLAHSLLLLSPKADTHLPSHGG